MVNLLYGFLSIAIILIGLVILPFIVVKCFFGILFVMVGLALGIAALEDKIL